MEWQPIQTAPKDGTYILVFDPYDEDRPVVMVQWGTEEYHYPGMRPRQTWVLPDTHQDEQGGASTVENPTHWMPLPKPPHTPLKPKRSRK